MTRTLGPASNNWETAMHRLLKSLAGIIVAGTLAPAASAGDACWANVRVDIFADARATTLVDTLEVFNTSASSSSRSGGAHSTYEIAIPAAEDTRGVDMVGTLTGRLYQFSMDMVSQTISTPGRTGAFRAKASWRISASKGRIVSAYRDQTVNVLVNGNTLVSKFSGHLMGQYFHGGFTFTCDRPGVYLPSEVFGIGSDVTYGVTFGYTGDFTAAARGLVPAVTETGSVLQDPDQTFRPGGPGTVSFDLVVPAGTTYARVALYDTFTDGSNDLDLYMYRVNGDSSEFVDVSGGATANEQVSLSYPEAGTYRVWVHGYATDGPAANFTLFSWVLGSDAAGNMRVDAPPFATDGTRGLITLGFSGLEPGILYLGSIAYTTDFFGDELAAPTIVIVDTREGARDTATVRLGWDVIVNGTPASCDTVGARHVRVLARDSFFGTTETEFECEQMSGAFEVHVAPYSFEIQLLDTAGQRLHDPIVVPRNVPSLEAVDLGRFVFWFDTPEL